MKKKINTAAILMGKQATYTDSLRHLQSTFTVGHVENAGKGDYAVYPNKHSNGIYIPREVIGELLQFGEVVRKINLGDGEIYVETWKLQ